MINFTVNGEKIQYEPAPGEEKLCLLDYLRDTLHLTGTKRGCEERVCNACTVLIDGVAKKSCATLMKDLEGKSVTTIEGLEKDGELDPVQAAFVEYNAVQCGFCTPGLIMAAKGLLNQNPYPTEEDIKKGLKLNLCRCGTYPRVIQAVMKAAAVQRGDKEVPHYHPLDLSRGDGFVGKSMPRRDLPDKVTGRTKFYADLYFENSMYGKAVYAEYPSAKILSIDTSPAYEVDGVQVVLTAKDVPGKNRFGVLCKDQPVFCEDRVKCIGDVVAVVFADTKAQAEEGAARVKVEYEPLEGIYSIEDALKPDAPLIPDPTNEHHPMAFIAGEHGNICKDVELHRGDVDAAFEKCAAVVEGDYHTVRQEHAWIEIDGSIATMEDGVVTIYAPNQSPFADRDQLAEILGVGSDEVHVKHMPAGGAFGGKTELTTHAYCAIATMKTGRPARMVLTRKDSLRTHPKRHPYDMHYKVGADENGKIMAMKLEALSDVGAYASWSPRVLEQGVSYCTGPYYIPNFNLHMQGIYTNNMVMGAFRGFGAIQTHFGAESIMDKLAEALHMDPLELRLRNALDKDLPMTTGQYPNTQGIDYKNTIKGARRIVDEIMPKVEEERRQGGIVGVGIASGWRSVAGGLGPAEQAGATFTLKPDGRVFFGIACTEMGQGSHTSLAQMAAELTGVAWGDFDIVAGDTFLVPFGGGVMASRGVYLWGHPTVKASHEFREKLTEAASALLDTYDDDIKLENSVLKSSSTGETLMTLAELASRVDKQISVTVDFELPKSNPVEPNANEDNHVPADQYNPHQTVSYNTTVAVVRIDPDTGAVSVPYMAAICDGGRIINPDAASQQIEGALIMGYGYGVTENFKIKDGINETNSLGKVKMPRIDNMPEKLEVHFTDANDQTGPLGAKGIAEVAVLTPAPAICNAIHDAVGLRIDSLPVNDHLEEIKEAAQAMIQVNKEADQVMEAAQVVHQA